jgi:deoxyhypusine synthase
MCDEPPSSVKDAVLKESCQIPADTVVVSGYDWNKGRNYDELFKSYLHSGFQASNFGKAVLQIEAMVNAGLEKNCLVTLQMFPFSA